MKNGATIGTLPTPKRTGYKFTGWYTAKTGGKKYTQQQNLLKIWHFMHSGRKNRIDIRIICCIIEVVSIFYKDLNKCYVSFVMTKFIKQER